MPVRALFLAALLFFTCAVSAPGQTVGYSISGDELIELELETGTAMSIGTIGTSGISGLAMSADGFLWAVSARTDDLWRIDPADASATRIGPLTVPLTDNFAGLAFDACGNLWLALDRTLYEVDTTTASLVERAVLAESVSGLTAIDDDLLAILVSAPPSLAWIDPEAGSQIPFGAPLPLPTDLAGLAFDSEGGLWTVLNMSGFVFPPIPISSILRLDPSTGEVLSTLEVLDPFGVFGANLAIAPPLGVCDNPAEEIPLDDPAALTLLAIVLGLGGLVLLRRA